jgi:uncharacterized protein YjiS (DUF1127 family)
MRNMWSALKFRNLAKFLHKVRCQWREQMRKIAAVDELENTGLL